MLGLTNTRKKDTSDGDSERREYKMDAKKIEELKGFVEQCKKNPSLLHTPSFAFFKDFLHSLGAQIPPSVKSEKDDGDYQEEKPFESQKAELEEDIVESDIEFDNSVVVDPDNDPPQKMGDYSAVVTEEKQEAAQLAKVKAMDAISEGKLNEAIDYLTEAIMSNPKSGILYATRASVYIKMKKPNAAIRDANAALKINTDSAKGYKARGMARAMLGLWEHAANDLHVAANWDFDEEISAMLKKVEPNANKIEEHRRKYDRLRKERELQKIRLQHPKCEAKSNDAKAAALLKDGEIIVINSSSELKTKLIAAAKTSRLSIVYFTATWCGPCRYISPVYTSLAGKYPKVVFLKVDIDEGIDAATGWNVSAIPTFFFVKNGKEVEKYVGVDSDLLEKKIVQHDW